MVNKQLLNYIKEHKDRYSISQIRNNLIYHGHGSDEVDKAILRSKGRNLVPLIMGLVIILMLIGLFVGYMTYMKSQEDTTDKIIPEKSPISKPMTPEEIEVFISSELRINYPKAVQDFYKLRDKKNICKYEIVDGICVSNHNVNIQELVEIDIVPDRAIVEDEFGFRIMLKNNLNRPLKIVITDTKRDDRRVFRDIQEEEIGFFFDIYLNVKSHDAPDVIRAGEEINFNVDIVIEDDFFNPYGYGLVQLRPSVSIFVDYGDGKEIYNVPAVHNNFAFFKKTEGVNSCNLNIEIDGLCKQGVFFANAECVDKCDIGSCVNGYCIWPIGMKTKEDKVGNGIKYYTTSKQPLLEGNSKMLVIIDEDYRALGEQHVDDMITFFEEWYRQRSLDYFGEEVVNFDFTVMYLDTKVSVSKGCYEDTDAYRKCLINKLDQMYDLPEYDQLQLLTSQEEINKACVSFGIVGERDACSDLGGLSFINAEETLHEDGYDTLVHEVYHSFGKPHIHGQYPGLITRSPNTYSFEGEPYYAMSLVTAAHVGWGDINNDGIVDIKQISTNPKDIVIAEKRADKDQYGKLSFFFELTDERGNLLVPSKDRPLTLDQDNELGIRFLPVYGHVTYSRLAQVDEIQYADYSFEIAYAGIRKTLEGSVRIE